MSFDWKAAVAGVAPAIGTALGGPGVGMAVSALARTLLKKDSATEAEIAAAVQGMTPADVLALKKADQDFALELKRIAAQADTLEASDRDSARKRDVATGSHDWVTRALALSVLGLFAAALFLLAFVPIPAVNRDAILQLIGVLYGAVMAVLGFYFGTSFGSRQKDATIASAVGK